MIGIVIAAHGHLATELIATAELIIGKLPGIMACEVDAASSPRAMEEALERAVHAVECGEGVLVLADLLGGTPCTRSLALCEKARLEVVTGVNLPMLLKAHSLRQTLPLRELARQVVDSVRSSICWVTESVPGRREAASSGPTH